MKIREITDKHIVFDDGSKMCYDHSQECCEHNWADFEYVKHCNLSVTTGKIINIMNVEFEPDLHKMFGGGVSKMGFILMSKDGDRFFVPCYSDQNGYYTDELILYYINANGKVEAIDVTDFVEERC